MKLDELMTREELIADNRALRQLIVKIQFDLTEFDIQYGGAPVIHIICDRLLLKINEFVRNQAGESRKVIG